MEGKYHSFDSYYKNVVLSERKLVIPYINLGIYNHPLNEGNDPLFLDRCFVILEDIHYLKVYDKPPLIDDQAETTMKLFFGGLNLDVPPSFIDITANCNFGYLEILHDSKISKDMWIPFETPNYDANMEINSVNEFFSSVYK